jgi:hypothetical protein
LLSVQRCCFACACTSQSMKGWEAERINPEAYALISRHGALRAACLTATTDKNFRFERAGLVWRGSLMEPARRACRAVAHR